MYLVRVPIRVEYDDSVSYLQVQPKPSSPGAQEEDEVWRVWGCEQLQQLLPIISFGPTIQSQIGQALSGGEKCDLQGAKGNYKV